MQKESNQNINENTMEKNQKKNLKKKLDKIECQDIRAKSLPNIINF